MDGTLVDSRLNFDAMRAEMDLPPGRPILEAIAELAEHRAAWCREVLHRHELEGARQATMMAGVTELLAELKRRGIHTAIATRNSRSVTEATLRNVGLTIELVMTRDDGPIKPDPWAIQHACRLWDIAAAEAVIVGDFRLDIEAGHAAGSRSVLLTHPEDPATYPNAERADLVLGSLAEYQRLLAWLGEQGASAL
jgi:HAD superfamily hydrolase (TIGR01509 family)